MIGSVFVYIYTLPWYALSLLLPVIAGLYAILVYTFKRRKMKVNICWSLALVLWVMVLLLATLHRQSSEAAAEGFLPLFQSYREAQSNPEIYREMFLNVVLFFPGGLFLCSLVPARWPKVLRVIVPAVLLGGLSAVIELVQLSYNLGLAEADDILHNSLGALLGAAAAMAITALFDRDRAVNKGRAETDGCLAESAGGASVNGEKGMEKTNVFFLQALKAALKHETVLWEDDLQPQDWQVLFQLAEKQHVLPLIYEAVYSCPAAKRMAPSLFQPYKQRTVQTVMLQTMKTSEFLTLYQAMREEGVIPLVVKGIICRQLYPNPDCRISGDEDILIPRGQYRKCHEVLLANGMECADAELDREQSYEVPYAKKGSPVYIEVHKSLFSPDSEAYGELNSFFEGVEERAIEIPVEGVSIRTMGYTDHLFYLICHAFKHFLHSGFGIRQVCDIIMMANAYGREIDWTLILEQAKVIHADLFAASVFQIGEKYLNFDPDQAAWSEEWRSIRVDEGPMLEDLLSGGIYGATDRERLHSSTVTLNAVAAQKKGKSGKASIWKSVFPSARDLSGRYPYLRTKPFLLPVAWVDRLITYKKELGSGRNHSAANSIRIGEQRIELLRQYGILDADD